MDDVPRAGGVERRPHPSFGKIASNFTEIPQGPTGPFSLKTVHWTVFRAFEPFPKGKAIMEGDEGIAPTVRHWCIS